MSLNYNVMLGTSAQQFLKIYVETIAQLRRQPEASVVHFLRARISLALKISQTRAVHERFRDSQLWIRRVEFLWYRLGEVNGPNAT